MLSLQTTRLPVATALHQLSLHARWRFQLHYGSPGDIVPGVRQPHRGSTSPLRRVCLREARQLLDCTYFGHSTFASRQKCVV